MPAKRTLLPARLLLAILPFLFILSACGSRQISQVEGPNDECGPIQPSENDIRFALSFARNVLEPTQWIRSYTVEPYKVSVTRKNDNEGAVAYTEYLLFNCGYSQADLDSYFSDENFNIVFGNYESHTLQKFCEVKGLALYEYSTVSAGTDFLARYWVKQESNKRLLVFMLVFPQSNQKGLDDYAKKIFPDLTTCP